MELTITPVTTDLVYKATFPEPMSELYGNEGTKALLKKLVKSFGLRLNDIKYNREAPSDKFLHFSKLKDATWFDVSFGLEEVTAILTRPLGEDQVSDLYSKLAECFQGHPMSRQQMNIQQQLSAEGDIAAFLESLNPNIPSGFQQVLGGRGASYTLKFSDQQLAIHITVASSLYLLGRGIFVAIENDFLPNKYDSGEAYKIVRNHREFILSELGLKLEV